MATQIIACKADTTVWTDNQFQDDYYNNDPGIYPMRILTSRPNVGFLQFDFPTFPNKQITKAELKLYCTTKRRRNILGAGQFNIPININTLNGRKFKNQYIDADMAWSPTELTSTYDQIFDANEWVSFDLTSIVANSQGLANAVIALVVNEDTGMSGSWSFNSIEADSNKPYIEVTYNDAVPDLPTILYPNGDVIEKGNALTFQWKHNSLYDTGQVKYDFGWRQQGNTSWADTLGVVSTTQSRTLDSNALPTGIIEWRVRTYNANNAASGYAYGSFELTGRPTAPIIDSMKNDAITEIAWRSNAAETAIYRLWIYQGGTLIHDSGERPGGISSSYIPNMMFANGQYTVRMRIGSVYGVWSDESAKVFTLSAAIPAAPDITLSAAQGGILISTSSTAADKIIYRSEDGIIFTPIGRFPGQTYTDYAVKSDVMYEYYICAHNGGFADSVKRTMRIKYKGCLLSDVNTPDDFIKMYKSDSDWYNIIKTSHENEAELIQYEGRIYPVKESGIHRQSEFGTSFYLDNKDAYKMEEMYKKNSIYLFRNDEVCLCCEISNYNHQNTLFNKGKNVEISLIRVDYNNGVRFDV
ncbi:DNRLRE domain-containing protein [Clostridium sp. HBUAS56010]|uniref:DNRLRE domain-containing protein n=1 Tax=Clostridium sp. HBUAS56010 TaxID=2571127 RepID=UPI00117786D0|nr:DNRLRE domain-containing protein [Clostridium sp. HBUAS56010]